MKNKLKELENQRNEALKVFEYTKKELDKFTKDNSRAYKKFVAINNQYQKLKRDLENRTLKD